MPRIRRWFPTLLLALLAFLPLTPSSAGGTADPLNTLRWKEGDRGDWFEWWYYKVVLPETDQSFYFIYGVVDPWDAAGAKPVSQAYVGFGDFAGRSVSESDFPARSFEARRDRTWIRIGDNLATDQRITGAVRRPDGSSASWDIQVERDWTFNAMGWASKTRDLVNIYWYPAQASARMSGWVEVNGKRTAFENARAYQDRNWGRSFPKWWTWLASNHFPKSPDTVLAAGGGRPDFFPGDGQDARVQLIDGICIGLRYQGKEYAWRTTDGNPVKMKISYGTWELSAENGHGYRIEISANAPKESFVVLPFQTPQGPLFYDYEALQGHLRMRLLHHTLLHGWKLVTELESEEAGIEYGSFDANPGEDVFNRETRIQP